MVVNTATLAHHLIWAEIDSNATNPAQQAVIIHPAVSLDEGTRYIVALRNMKDSGGALLTPNPDFVAYRDNTPLADTEKEARRPHMESIFATLAAAGVARNDLYLAWDFTVASASSTTRASALDPGRRIRPARLRRARIRRVERLRALVLDHGDRLESGRRLQRRRGLRSRAACATCPRPGSPRTSSGG